MTAMTTPAGVRRDHVVLDRHRERDLDGLAMLMRRRPEQRPPSPVVPLHVLAQRRARAEVQQ
jgi:hypothetical protein